MAEDLKQRVEEAYNNYENTPIETILELLHEIKNQFKTNFTANYLAGKLDDLSKTTDQNQKLALCKKLKPYLDWYLSGNL